MTKQVLRVLLVALVVLAVASPSWASTVNSVLDAPTTGGGTNMYVLPYGTSGTTYTMSWQTCAPYNDGSNPEGTSPVPPNEPASGYLDCLAIFNQTGAAITNLMINVPLTGPALDDSYVCNVSASTTGFSCSESVTGDVLTLDFNGLPGFASGTAIYFGIGCAATDSADDCTDTGTQDLTGVGDEATVVTPSYDPSTLVLLGVGIASLAMFGAMRRYA